MAMSKKPVPLKGMNAAYAEALASVSKEPGDAMSKLEQQIIDLCESGQYDQRELDKLLAKMQEGKTAEAEKMVKALRMSGTTREDLAASNINMRMSLEVALKREMPGLTENPIGEPSSAEVRAYFAQREGRELSDAEANQLLSHMIDNTFRGWGR